MVQCQEPAPSPGAAPKPQDEKITINLGCVDLGQIDLLVQEGFYANRTTSSARRSGISWRSMVTRCGRRQRARRCRWVFFK